jgi:long-chain acyl-CoA synthetase
MSSNGNQSRVRGSEQIVLEQVLRKRRLLLTGSTGFLGKVFLMLLLRHHPEIERVYLLIRGDRRAALSRFRREVLDSPVMGPLREHLGERFERYVAAKLAVVPGDITDPGLVTDAADLPRRGIDAVVHCAGLVNFDASLERALSVNTQGVANVIEFCRQHEAALLHVSTCYVAGGADGHRYEDDLPSDWCPNGRHGFNLQREIRDALAAVARIEAESRDQAHNAEFQESGDETDAAGGQGQAETRRKRWVEERFKQVGRDRAQSWGWPNTYSYTKSLGEQLVLVARGSITAVVVRPSVIESALSDPFPGWNQGVNTSAPLTYLSGRGYRFYPAKGELVLDVLPVDLAAHAMIPILAALLLKRHEPVYQLCTSDRNPLTMRQLVELTALGNRREQRRAGGAMAKLAPHFEAVVVSRTTYDLVSGAAPQLLKHLSGFARTVFGAGSTRARAIEHSIDRLCENTELAREMVEVYRPYISELSYTFHSKNARALYARLRPADAACHPYQPERIDWADYWVNVHLPGLRRHIFGQLELHTRGRPRLRSRHRTLVDLLDYAAENFGGHPALLARKPSGDRTTLSYRELRDGAARAALMLRDRGVETGDRVLLIGENSPAWVIAFFAIVKAGAIAVPLDHNISSEELAAICAIAEPRAALCSSAVTRRLGSGLKEAAGKIVELQFDDLQRPFILRRKRIEDFRPDRTTVASIVFTSGTTGAPKGVMLTHANFTAEVSMLARVFALDREDLVLSLLPLHHTFEFTCGMLLPLASGSTVAYPLGVDAANLARTLADLRPTALIGVPAVWEAVHRRIVDDVEARGPFFHAAFDQLRAFNRRFEKEFQVNLGSILFRQAHAALGGRLKLTVSGGAALPQRVAEFFNDIGIRLLEGYGMTEAAPVISTARPDETLTPGSVGKPLSGMEVRLDRGETPEIGEIVVRGANLMSGYFRNPTATAEVLEDGWLRTGDLGRFDDQGRLYIVGRAKDVIVDSGGNNVYIDELEEAYGHSPFLKELAVVGLKIGEGEQVAALAVPAYARGESRRAVEERLRAHFEKVGAELSPHKRIRILRFTDHQLPRTGTRKIKRQDVAELIREMVETDGERKVAVAGEIEPWLVEALLQVSSGQLNITPSTRLIEDLGLDSLALAELGEQLSGWAARDVSPEELADLKTVEDLQKLASQGRSRPRLPSYARFAQPYTLRLPAPLRALGTMALSGAARAAFDRWLKPQVLGRGNIAHNRNLLVVANHSSHLDFGLVTYALGEIGRELVVLAAKDYFFNSGLRRLVANNFTRLIPFDRERAQLESLDEALDELAAGRSVLMFPEGTRSPDGDIHEFKSGAGYLAMRSRCDVLPIRITGTYQVLGKGKLIPRHYPVEVRIGRVIANDELRQIAEEGSGAGGYRKLADYMRQTVAALGERPAAVTARGRVPAKTADDREPPAASHGVRNRAGRGRAKA